MRQNADFAVHYSISLQGKNTSDPRSSIFFLPSGSEEAGVTPAGESLPH
jgi:hypothetical protein